MTHWAKIDENNLVEMVIVSEPSELDTNGHQWCIDNYGGDWAMFDINDTPAKPYPGIGYSYDATTNIFVPPAPFDSWIFDSVDLVWKAPIDKPASSSKHVWNEDSLSWVEIALPE